MKEAAREREGIHAVSLAFIRQLSWFPRELPQPDRGVDLYVETSDTERLSGRLLAVQVKAGPSYFKESTAEGVVFRDGSHLDYWLGHSIPVIVALYDPSAEICYWQVVARSTVVSTGAGWKMLVPWTQRIDADSAEALATLAEQGGRDANANAEAREPDAYVRALSDLRADRAWMDAIADGTRLLVEVDDWVNKLSGRGTMRLILDAGHDRTTVRSRDFFAPAWDYADLLPILLPWADLAVDPDTYDDADRARWDLETGAWDNEEGRYIVHSVDFAEWLAANVEPGLRPYEDDGEVARWRLEATLNELGESFLTLDDFLEDRARDAPLDQ